LSAPSEGLTRWFPMLGRLLKPGPSRREKGKVVVLSARLLKALFHAAVDWLVSQPPHDNNGGNGLTRKRKPNFVKKVQARRNSSFMRKGLTHFKQVISEKKLSRVESFRSFHLQQRFSSFHVPSSSIRSPPLVSSRTMATTNGFSEPLAIPGGAPLKVKNSLSREKVDNK
jgi:hypothetical protein